MATIGPSITLTSVGPAGAPDISYSNCYAVFQSPWGVDHQVQICTSFSDFTRLYGGLSKLTAVASGTTADTYTTETTDAVVQAYYAIKGYFDEKGANSPGVLMACRTIASSAGPTAASTAFLDKAGTSTTTVTAKWKGRDGGTVQTTIINPSPRKNIFVVLAGTVAVTSGATTVTSSVTPFTTGSTWVGYGIKIGLNYYTIASVTSTSVLVLNSNAVATETAAVVAVGTNASAAYIKWYHPQSSITEEWDFSNATDMANISKLSQLATMAISGGTGLPMSATVAKLNAGSAATADPYTASDADYGGTTTAAGVKTGLQVFTDPRLGTGLAIIPGKVSSTVRSSLITFANNTFRHALLGCQAGLTLSTAQTEFAGSSSNHASAYFPRIWVSDQNSTSGGALLIDNVGHIAGLAARMDRDNRGPHKSPSGLTNKLSTALDVERTSVGMELVDDSGSNTLADVYVNTLRSKNGIISWGMRTLASDERYRQINVSRTVELVYLSCTLLMEKYVGEVIDPFGRLFARVKADLDSFLWSLWTNSSLYGTKPGNDPKPSDAWFTVCSTGNNNNINLAKGEIRADVSFVPSPNVEKITLNLYVAAPGFGNAAAAAGASV